MNKSDWIKVAVVVTLLTAVSLPRLVAAPVESVESSRAAAAIDKIDAFLAEEAVAKQLADLGMTREEATARMCKLSDAQLEELAASVDRIKAGGTIQGGDPACNPVANIFVSIGNFLKTFFCLFFCWKPT